MNPCTCARANVSSVSQAGLDAASPAIIFCIGPWLFFVAGNSPGGDSLTREGVTAFRLIPHFQTIAPAFSNYCFYYCSGIPAYSPQARMIILVARLNDVNYIGCNYRPSPLSFRLLDWHSYKFLIPSLFSKPLLATFDQPDSSSDGGALLLKGIDSQMHLSERLAACIEDAPQQGKVLHSIHDLLRHRVYGIACGYAHCNDAARLANDPVQKLLLDRDPIKGDPDHRQSRSRSRHRPPLLPGPPSRAQLYARRRTARRTGWGMYGLSPRQVSRTSTRVTRRGVR